MKDAKTILAFLVLTLCSNFSYGQEINIDTTIANEYRVKADKYNLNRKRDSSTVYYRKASEIYWNNYKITNNRDILKKYLHCQNNLAYDLAYAGESKSALKIAQNAIEICNTEPNTFSEYIASAYLSLAYCYDNNQDFENALTYYEKSLEVYEEIKDTNNVYVARAYANMAILFYYYGMYDYAIQYSDHALDLMIQLFGEENTNSAALYNINGVIYEALGELEVSEEYQLKALSIFSNIGGEETIDVANVSLNLGGFHQRCLQYTNALKYYEKALKVYRRMADKDDINVANVYNNIGVVYNDKGEYNLALEYYMHALSLYLKLVGENNWVVATLYNNIGVVYETLTNYEQAIEFYNNALQVRTSLFGNENFNVAVVYGNMGVLYLNKEEYDIALKYLNKSLQIKEKVLGKSNIENSIDLLNIGRVYKGLGDIENSIRHYEEALNIKKGYFGEKHLETSYIYNNLGVLYYDENDLKRSLQYLQKAIIAISPDFNDTNIYSNPIVEQVENKQAYLSYLNNKIDGMVALGGRNSIEIAFAQAMICDTLISEIRKQLNTKVDKLTLGEEANEIYQKAVEMSLKLMESSEKEKIPFYTEKAFYFSEKNKSSVLLEALAGAEAQKFAGIPDSLLKKENDLSIDMALYNKLLAEKIDSAQEIIFRDKLFTANRQYDKLIKTFEENYSDYFDLKYNQEPASVSDIQNLLDNKTAIISYFMGDSITTIFTITQNNLSVNTMPTIENLADTIKYYRYGLVYTSSSRFAERYKNQAYQFYKKLIPNINNNIENLIIIPDAELSMIPFETLLTERAGNKEWNELPYLVKKYNISYSYSANLFYKTFPKEPANRIETTDLNDWLAFAPVFDNSNTAGLTLRTRELLRDFDSNVNDTINTRGRLIDGGYVSSLPGTESEVKSIFKAFDEKGKKAQVQIKMNANEEFIKSGGLENYKYLHFATHGFVNTKKPELSGIFLAQDSTLSEDGILYQGEIYNLDLNADLTVLSACETGLGQIKKGEGLIGLTRALLYAGSKNIIVSLWSVADESTSYLMINFYKNLLEENQKKVDFSKALRQSKLVMIYEGKYAHPFYWSPFILIGK